MPSLEGRTTLKARLSPLLWRYAAQVRARRDARGALAKDIGNENLSEWPGPIAKFLIGRLPAGELEVAAESDEVAKRSNGKCPAAFFIGMDARSPRRQAARARAAAARPGALPDHVGIQLGGIERAEAALSSRRLRSVDESQRRHEADDLRQDIGRLLQMGAWPQSGTRRVSQ